MRRTLFTLLRLAVGIGVLAYLVNSKIINLHALSRLISVWPISLAAVGLLLIDLGLMALRLCCLFRPQGLHLGWSDSLRLTALSSFFASFLPGRAGGDLVKIFYASKENSGRRTEIVAVLLFDRALGLFSLLLLPLLLAPFFPDLLRLMAIRVGLSIMAFLALGMVSAFLACLLAPALVGRLLAWSNKLLPGEVAGRFLGTVGAYGRRPGMLAGALGISLADNLMGIGILALALLAVNPASLAARLCVLVPIGQIVNSLPFTPGGLGVGETAFHALFSIAGLKGGADALLCWRVWNVLVGVLGLIVYLRGFQARIFEVLPDRAGALNMPPNS